MSRWPPHIPSRSLEPVVLEDFGPESLTVTVWLEETAQGYESAGIEARDEQGRIRRLTLTEEVTAELKACDRVEP